MMRYKGLISEYHYNLMVTTAPLDIKLNTLLLQQMELMDMDSLKELSKILEDIETQKEIASLFRNCELIYSYFLFINSQWVGSKVLKWVCAHTSFLFVYSNGYNK